jgi:hypothetical protein
MPDSFWELLCKRNKDIKQWRIKALDRVEWASIIKEAKAKLKGPIDLYAVYGESTLPQYHAQVLVIVL